MTIIEPNTGWFEIIEVPTYDINDVTGGNEEYIDKYSARVIHLFNNIWLIRYSNPHKVVFDNVYEFEQ